MSYTVKDVLRMEVAPALGCTEPSAVALSAAVAASVLGREFESIELWLDPNTYKNGIAVSIPGVQNYVGIDLAAALGAFGGDPALKLEVLDPLTPEIVEEAVKFVREGRVQVHVLEKGGGIYVRTHLTKGSENAEAIIEKFHDRVTSIKHNGRELKDHPLLSRAERAQHDTEKMEKWLSGLSLAELVQLLDSLDEEDLRFLAEGVEYNMRLAEYGLTYGPGLGVGSTLERLVREGLTKKDMVMAARILTSAAADARMSGVKLPAMSSAGSGNHGLTAILPIRAVRDYIQGASDMEMLKAIALSHIITAYVKAYTGRLSAVCGCSVAAGAGATAGITYLMGGNLHHIAGAIKNLIADLAGVICDGAKASCALKLATAAGVAVQSALFSLHGLDVKATDGIIAATPEQTMRNVGQLSTQGMIETDRIILQIMIDKQFKGV